LVLCVRGGFFGFQINPRLPLGMESR
jgi:hypothetical protein